MKQIERGTSLCRGISLQLRHREEPVKEQGLLLFPEGLDSRRTICKIMQDKWAKKHELFWHRGIATSGDVEIPYFF